MRVNDRTGNLVNIITLLLEPLTNEERDLILRELVEQRPHWFNTLMVRKSLNMLCKKATDKVCSL